MPTPMYDMLVTQLTEHLGVLPENIRPDATLEDLEIDSLALVELMVIFEEDLGVTFDLDTREAQTNDLTLVQVAEMLESLRAAPQAAAAVAP